MKRDIIQSSILTLLLSILGFTLTGCSSASSDEPVTPAVPLTIVNKSIADGDKVSTDITSMTVEYSHPIALDSKIDITLNNKPIQASTSNKLLTLSLELAEGTTYTLSIPTGAVVRKDDNKVKAEPLTVNFSTPEPVVVGNIDPLCNPNATQATKNVYKFLIDNYGKKTLSGVMANVNNNNEYSDLVFKTTGRHPALTGYDFLHLNWSPANWIDYSNISFAREQWENNGLVSYMWHWNVPPYEGAPIDKHTASANNGFDIRRALTDGTWENQFILQDIEKVAGYLKLLQDAGIPVIWRPLHEADGNYTKYAANGAWFWWGDKGSQYTKQLWLLLYDKLVNQYGLNNLIWVWTIQVSEGYENAAIESYPGDKYVDIVGVDIYSDNTRAKNTEFNFMNQVTRGKKLTTVSECGNIPNPDKNMQASAFWSWFMVWYCRDDKGNLMITNPTHNDYKLNTSDYWKEVLRSQYVLTREDMPSLK